jgi:hypothetical protein
MECPLCGALAVYANGVTPLLQPQAGSQVRRAKREVAKAAQWARNNNSTTLEGYLKAFEGRPYADHWTDAEVQQADQQASVNP